jgi:hypothetical protein
VRLLVLHLVHPDAIALMAILGSFHLDQSQPTSPDANVLSHRRSASLVPIWHSGSNR